MSEEHDPPGSTWEGAVRPTLRADAARNREHLLISAAATFLREGPRFTMQTIARDAGVGAGTLYRHFPDREVLLAALVSRSYGVALATLRRARASTHEPLEAIRAYLLGILDQRDVLVLPLRGAPPSTVEADVQARRTLWEELGDLLRAGQAAGTIRPDVNPLDVMIASARLAQRIPNLPDERETDRRQAAIFVDGLRASAAVLSEPALTLPDLERAWQTEPREQ
ncbi:TetR/AcrR family transcriptional regulator [Deinococcus aestuarii]|uniref:TetR/AcrR family transcriptional regulator n=1 Tax=Deinococcus aestuarii TaxID=2774531 RepID=UPI001C0B3013|nr:TetR/AcrR family transcriptional regulator [Deinococcus aestuarii]